MNLHRILRRAESIESLDAATDAAADAARRVVDGAHLGPLLRGSWLGHPVHPLLVTLPIGTWMTSLVFDVALKDPATARRLIGIGLLTTPPTVLAGWADYPLLNTRQRRVGLIHAGSNALGASMFALAYRAYRRDRLRPARVYALLGLTAIGVGGALGGHLSYAQGAGMLRWQPGRALAHGRLAERLRAA